MRSLMEMNQKKTNDVLEKILAKLDRDNWDEATNAGRWRDGRTSSCDHDFEIFVISILLSNKAWWQMYMNLSCSMIIYNTYDKCLICWLTRLQTPSKRLSLAPHLK
jgi:hypothetical protein